MKELMQSLNFQSTQKKTGCSQSLFLIKLQLLYKPPTLSYWDFLKTSKVFMIYTLGYQPPVYLKIEYDIFQKNVVISIDEFWNIINLIKHNAPIM